MTRLRWLARLAAQRVGWQGIAGLGLLAATGAFCVGVVAPLDVRITELKAQMALPHNARDDSAGALRTPDPATELDAFYQSLPDDDALTELLAKLHGIGERNGLALQQADYRAIDERGPRLGQYRIVVPATTTYPQLKHFLAAVLTDMPNLSLDQISLQRNAAADARVDVQMQFTLYLRQRT